MHTGNNVIIDIATILSQMFTYVLHGRAGIAGTTAGEGFPVEVFSDTTLDIGEHRLSEVEIIGGKIHHYAGSVDRRSLESLSRIDSVLGPYWKETSSAVMNDISFKFPEIMGIMNMTGDSFYSGSRLLGKDLSTAEPVISGSDIVDIGGESTRPGALPVPISEEIERVKSALKFVRSIGDFPVSIDTMHHETVESMLRYEISYVNDVSGFRDDRMIKIASREGLKCIIMHMRGVPRNMMEDTSYSDVLSEVSYFLFNRARKLIENGINFNSIIIDPGIGFSKGLNENLEIFRNIRSFRGGFRLLVGHSRKSFLGKIMENDAADRLPATLSASNYLFEKGVDILRVHDPVETRFALRTFDFLRKL